MIKKAGPLSGKTGMAAKVAQVTWAIFLNDVTDGIFLFIIAPTSLKFWDMERPYGLHLSTKFQICSCRIREVILVILRGRTN